MARPDAGLRVVFREALYPPKVRRNPPGKNGGVPGSAAIQSSIPDGPWTKRGDRNVPSWSLLRDFLQEAATGCRLCNPRRRTGTWERRLGRRWFRGGDEEGDKTVPPPVRRGPRWGRFRGPRAGGDQWTRTAICLGFAVFSLGTEMLSTPFLSSAETLSRSSPRGSRKERWKRPCHLWAWR